MTSKVGAYSYKLLLQDCLKGMQEISSNNIDITIDSDGIEEMDGLDSKLNIYNISSKF